MVYYSRAERVFILEHHFASISFAAVSESFSNAYPDKELPNKTTIYRLVTKFRDTGSVCHKSSSRKNYGRTDFKQLQQRDTIAAIQYCHWLRRFVREEINV
jgi:hypothetical protein